MAARSASDYVFEFSTPVPELQDAQPANGYRWLAPDAVVKLVLNQPVKDVSKHARFIVEGESQPRPVKVLKEVSIADERRADEAQAHPRRFARMDDEARGFRNQQTRYELGSDKPFPTDRAVKLVVDAGLQGAQGPLTLTRDIELGWRTYGPLQITASRMCTGDYRCPVRAADPHHHQRGRREVARRQGEDHPVGGARLADARAPGRRRPRTMARWGRTSRSPESSFRARATRSRSTPG